MSQQLHLIRRLRFRRRGRRIIRLFRRCLKLQLTAEGKTGYVWLAPGVGVVVAAIRSGSCLSAIENALAKDAISPRPATRAIRMGGNAAKIATSEAPNIANMR